MASNHDDQNSIRRYLLNQLTDDGQQQIERELLTDDERFEQLQGAEDGLIDQYLAGELSKDEAEMFEKHFLATPERQQKLRFAKAFRRYVATHAIEQPQKTSDKAHAAWTWPKLFSASPLRAAAFAALILIAGLAVWRIFFYQSDVDRGLIALNSAYREQRPVEARITQLNYAPFVTTRGSGSDGVNESELRRAELTLLDALNKKPTPAAHHALGKVYLAKKDFDRAIAQFEEALKADPNNAQIYADLGAAWLEKGKSSLDKGRANPTSSESGKGMEELGRSLENLNKALELDNTLLEPLFNRALCHQYLGLFLQAKSDWLEYLKKDPSSPWASEARKNSQALESQEKNTSKTREQIFEEFLTAYNSHDRNLAFQLISNYQNRGGNVAVEQMLDLYLQASLNGQRSDADRQLSVLKDVGQAALEKTGERFFLDLARFYQTVTHENQPMLSQARSLMQKGHSGWGQVSADESLATFNQARELFLKTGDVYEARFAQYWMSFSYSRKKNYHESLALIEPLIKVTETDNHKWLNVRALYLLSGLQFSLNQHSKALEFATDSLERAQALDDTVGMVNALISLIEYNRYLGNHQKSLSYIQVSLPLANSITLDPVQGARYFGFQALTFVAVGLFAAAADYQKEALRYALATGVDAVLSYNYAFLAIINGKLAKFDEALGNAADALKIAEARSSERPFRNLMAYALLQSGNINKDAAHFDKAIEDYNRAIKLYEDLELPTHLYFAHKGKLLCYSAVQNDQLTRTELTSTLVLLESYRDKIWAESDRTNFFDTEQSVYDIAIAFEAFRMNNAEAAFNYSESSKARSLLDLISNDALIAHNQNANRETAPEVTQPLGLSEISKALPEQVQIVQYAVLKNKVLLWRISREGFSSYNSPITEEELTEKVVDYLNVVKVPSLSRVDEIRLSRELFKLLIGPVEADLNDKYLVIIPDKILSLLPFAALSSPNTGKYLIQDYVMEIAPSSSVFLKTTQVARNKETGTSERLLSVGNPQFDRNRFPSLSNLPDAAKEAEGIASLYDRPVLLTNRDATKDAVSRELKTSQVIHLALHSEIDERFPLRSKLVLAKNGQAQDALSAFEIYQLDLPQAKLVVLSSCRTGAEKYYRGEGVISLARAFVSTGIPLVVASLWPVDSDSTTQLMIHFHKLRRREGLFAVDALRKAQLQMLQDNQSGFQHPYYWASFTMIGGFAGF